MHTSSHTSTYSGVLKLNSNNICGSCDVHFHITIPCPGLHVHVESVSRPVVIWSLLDGAVAPLETAGGCNYCIGSFRFVVVELIIELNN